MFSNHNNSTKGMFVKCEIVYATLKSSLLHWRSHWLMWIAFDTHKVIPQLIIVPLTRWLCIPLTLSSIYSCLSLEEACLPLTTCLTLKIQIDSLDPFWSPVLMCPYLDLPTLPSGQQLIIIGPDHLQTQPGLTLWLCVKQEGRKFRKWKCESAFVCT